MSHQALTPLICATCGAPVPLRQGNPLTCPHCGGSVPIPTEYDRLRQAMQREAEDQALAHQVYQHLTGPPGPGYRFWVSLGGVWSTGLILLVVGAALFAIILAGTAFFTEADMDLTTACIGAVVIALTFIPVSTEWFFHANAPYLHRDLADVLSQGRLHAILAVCTVLFLGIPLAMMAYFERIETVRQELRSAMAAHPPLTPGGSATCRQCGAPLDVAPGALGIRCLYCGTDNLLNIPHGEAASAMKRAKTAHVTLHDAVARLQQARFEARLAPWRLLGVAVVVVPLMGFGGWLTERLVEDGPVPPDWTRAVQAAPVLYSTVKDRPNASAGQPATLTYSIDEVHNDTDGGDSQAACYFIALRRGQGGLHFDLPDDVSAHVQRRSVSPWYRPEWTWATDNTPIETWVAPYDGWYRVKLARPGSAPEAMTFTFTKR